MTRIGRFRRGQSTSSLRSQLNALVDRANSIEQSPVGPVGLAPVNLDVFLIVEVRGLDLPSAGRLECVNVGQALNPSAIVYPVDLPWTLTEAARAGTTYTYTDINNRTAANPAETQTMTPLYILGDLLLITNLDSRWRDLNIDGRQWAKVP